MSTPTIVSKQRLLSNIGEKLVVRGTIAFDSSYATNGEAILLSQLGLTTIDQMIVYPQSGYVFVWDNTNNKIKAYWVPTGTNASAQALGEVANNTDLSALNAVPFEAIGS